MLANVGFSAATRAGYTPLGLRRIAAKLWSNVDISATVRDAQKEILKENCGFSPALSANSPSSILSTSVTKAVAFASLFELLHSHQSSTGDGGYNVNAKPSEL